MGGNLREAGRQRKKKKRERQRKKRKEKSQNMEESDEWKHIVVPVVFDDEVRVWVRTNESEEVVVTYLREQYGMHSWFKGASRTAVRDTVKEELDRLPWVDEVLWKKPYDDES